MYLEKFDKELNLIRNQNIRAFTEATLKNAPDYFWIAQASSSGKYHPECTNKEGGLVVHVKRAVYMANRLCEGWGIFNLDRDIVLSSTILHDIAKVPGTNVAAKYNMNWVTEADFVNHPINASKYWFGLKETVDLGIDTLAKISNCVQYHMGRWTPDSIKKEIKDYSLLELCVYTADYIATTKDLITPVDGVKNT